MSIAAVRRVRFEAFRVKPILALLQCFCQPTSRTSLDAITPFSSRIQRIRPYDSNPYMADASAASESVFITAPLAFQFQKESSGSGSDRTPGIFAFHLLHRVVRCDRTCGFRSCYR